MKYKPSIAFNALSGTAQGVTASRNNAGLYIHTKVTPGKQAPSTHQQQVKAIFAALQKSWKNLTQEQMNHWQQAALTQQGRRILGQTVSLTGINLYQRLNFWVVKCGGTALTTPPALTGVETPSTATIVVSASTFTFKLDSAPSAAGLKLVILVTAPQSMGTTKPASRGASVTDPVTANTTAIDLRQAYIARHGEPGTALPKIYFRYFLVNPTTGECSLPKQAVAIYTAQSINHTLTLTSNNPSYGTVSPAQPTQYPEGTSVTISATPATGYVFSKWSDNNSQTPRTIVVDQDITLQATFVIDNFRTITTEATPTGCGHITGGGTYQQGEQVVLRAVAASGCYFQQWEDDEWAPQIREITVVDDATYHAIFKSSSVQHKVEISVDKPICGTTDPEPATYMKDHSEDLEVLAVPNEDNGGVFVSWSDGNRTNPRTFRILQNTKIRALFTSEYEVFINVDWEGPGRVTGGGTFHIGDTVTVTATPNTGATFIRWEDGQTQNPRSFVATEDVTMFAYFE